MLSNEEFQKKLKDVGKGISTSTIYKGNDTIMDCTCEYKHHFKTKAFNLIYNKNGCPVCSGRQVNVGVNDMWTTNPLLANLLLNPEDGFKYSKCSEKKVWWKCPCCDEHIYKKISYVSTRGLVCNKCSDGISFPNRFMYNVLSQLNIKFDTEYVIEGASYRYDFYIPRYNLIIEMQGKQHYEGWNNKQVFKEDIQFNDENKRIFALNSGVSKYIQIDARETTKNFLSNNIENSLLSEIFDFDNFDWDLCFYNSIKSFVFICAEYYNLGMSTTDISNKTNFSLSTILGWLKIATQLNLCNWKPSKGFLKEEKPVILINTKTVYCSISEASRCTNLNLQNISSVCKGQRKYCGIDSNGNPMIWRFVDEYDETEDFSNIKVRRKEVS